MNTRPLVDSSESKLALAALRQAAVACQAIQAKLVPEHAVTKQDKSPVTAADFASQAVVCAHLARTFPHDAIIAEEAAAALLTPENEALRSLIVQQVAQAMQEDVTQDDVLGWIDRGSHQGQVARAWTLDPIDGTKGFLRRGQYAIALALIEQGQVTLGALACPELTTAQASSTHPSEKGTLLLAIRDGGVWRHDIHPQTDPAAQGRRVHATPVNDLAHARLCESVESGHSDQDASALIAHDLDLTAPPIRMDSQAKYATLACGDGDIYLRLPRNAVYREMIWDHAAGALAVQEAGGTVSDIHGQPLDFSLGRRLENNLGVVATTGSIHAQVLAAVQKHVKI